MPITTCVFDAYGTLFDVAAAAREAAAEPGRGVFAEKWPAIAQTWRLKQLQYTWLRATAGVHQDFWTVTQDGLDYALEEQAVEDAELRARLLQLYWELSAYPEVPEMLRALKEAGMNTAILSNGTPDMLEGAVNAAGIGEVLDACLSVQSLGVYKPHRSVYGLVRAYFGCSAREVLFVSSNCWDACAASGYGFHTIWANRAGEPMDRLPWKPAHVLSDLTSVPSIAAAA
ncbi:MAG: haloacid dehalogenase type II [Paracoccaceae bacterium]|nr:haloacid dehalogenase type II [Paracoccaceae bacterium]